MKLDYWVRLLADTPRLDAFRAGIRAAVRPGDRVLEIGTGLGTFAFMAAEAGAAEVVAIDLSPVVHLAETFATRNGLGERIRFVRGSYPEFDPGGPFDVVIFEDFASHGLLDSNTASVLSAIRDRDLAPGGRVVPESVSMHVAPVHEAVVRREVWGGTDPTCLPDLGMDRELVTRQLCATPIRRWLRPDALVGRSWDADPLPVLEAHSPDGLDLLAGWRAGDAAEVGGLALWFSLHLHAERAVTNAPVAESDRAGVWGQLLLPFETPVAVEEGAAVDARVRRSVREDGSPGWFSWEIEADGVRRSAHEFEGALIAVPQPDE